MAVTPPEGERLSAELATALAQLAELEKVNIRLRRQVREARSNETRVLAQLRSMRRTVSWRITFPFRIIARMFVRAGS